MWKNYRAIRKVKLRKQKSFLILCMFVFVSILSVGYASFSTIIVLNAKGNIRVDSECVEGKIWEFSYANDGQEFVVPCSGDYRVELWGASGDNHWNPYVTSHPAYGGYVSGKIHLKMRQKLYLYVGGESKIFNCSETTAGTRYSGGATDIRTLKTNDWSDFVSLASRIMVAGGAGRTYTDATGVYGGHAGGLESYEVPHTRHSVYKATQTSGGAASTGGTAGRFGIGGRNANSGYSPGAGGYYGGGGGPSGGGGSSFISGHNGCDAIAQSSTEDNIIHTGQSIHYSGLYFTDTVMIDGKGYKWEDVRLDELGSVGMPTHDGTGTMTGNDGDGFAKITLIVKKM